MFYVTKEFVDFKKIYKKKKLKIIVTFFSVVFCVADIGFTSLGYRELTIQQSYLSGCISVSYPLSAFLAMDCNNVSQ